MKNIIKEIRKKIINKAGRCAVTFSLIAVTLTMTGCAGKQSGFNNNSNGKYSVVCTIFPEYDWVKQIHRLHI